MGRRKVLTNISALLLYRNFYIVNKIPDFWV